LFIYTHVKDNIKKMESIKKIFFSLIICCLLLLSGCTREKIYKVYYLGGQSNMDGYGFIKDLPAEINMPAPGLLIFHGNTSADEAEADGKGIWATLQPGHGTGFTSDGKENKYSDRFGVELTFGIRMKQLNPDENIAILKYSRGGTSLDTAAQNFGTWEENFLKGNGINQYDHFMAAVKYAMQKSDIDGDGRSDKIEPAGIIWMQGESDGTVEKSALKYEENLKHFISLVRKAFNNENMPVVLGRISDSHNSKDGNVWVYGDVIRKAQADFVEKDGNAALVISTDNYGYSDPWHYNSAGYIDLGNKFAEALYNLKTKK
jgi:hypothetical protein